MVAVVTLTKGKYLEKDMELKQNQTMPVSLICSFEQVSATAKFPLFSKIRGTFHCVKYLSVI